MGKDNLTKGQDPNSIKDFEIKSVWKKKLPWSKESFFRKALISLAKDEIYPGLLFGDFEISEINDEFFVASTDIDIDYSFELGTPHVVTAEYLGHDIRDVVLDWNLVQYNNHEVIHIACNKNMSNIVVDSSVGYDDKQKMNRELEEMDVSRYYKEAIEKRNNAIGFPAEEMRGEFEELPIESFEFSEKDVDDLISLSWQKASRAYKSSKHAKNLKLDNLKWNTLQAYGLVIPRYKLTYKYRNSDYSILSNIWLEDSIEIDQNIPSSKYDLYTSNRKGEPLYDKMIKQIEDACCTEQEVNQIKGTQQVKKAEPTSKITSMINKIIGKVSELIGIKAKAEVDSKDIVNVKIQVSTKNGVEDRIVSYSRSNDPKLPYSTRDAQWLIGVAMALARYNLAPLTEDEYKEFRWNLAEQ